MRSIQAFGTMLTLAATVVLLDGCAATYQAVGMYEGRQDVLVGTVHADLSSGTSHFSLVGEKTGLRCDGVSAVQKVTMSFSCQGQSGSVNATCSDGSILTGRWYATSCTTGFGYGIDSAGNKLTFRFGLTNGEVKAQVESDKRALAAMQAQHHAAAMQPPPSTEAPAQPSSAAGAQSL